MPIYEYACTCGKHFEEMRSFSAPPHAKCPKCGKKAQRVISLAAFHLKGSGWYSKDSKPAHHVKKEPAAETVSPETTKKEETKPAEAADAEKKKPEKKEKEKKKKKKE